MEAFLRHWEMIVGRLHGPLAFRLVLQPLVATVLAIRAGARDARAGRPAFGWAIVTSSAERHDLLREGWKELTKVFVAAVVIDLIYEVIVFHWIYLTQAVIVAAILALLPYPLIRGLTNRIIKLYYRAGARSGAPAEERAAAAPFHKGES